MFELTPFARGNRYISSYDPFRVFDDLEKSFFHTALPTFKTDIRETSDGYVIEAELPGFAKEDINIEVKGGYLTIHAERKTETDKTDGYIRRERTYGSFTRSFDLDGIKEEEIRASYKDGILSLNLPKAEVKVDTGRRLEIQ